MQVGEFRLWSFVREERERATTEVLVIPFHAEHGVGHFEKEQWVVVLERLQLAGGV